MDCILHGFEDTQLCSNKKQRPHPMHTVHITVYLFFCLFYCSILFSQPISAILSLVRLVRHLLLGTLFVANSTRIDAYQVRQSTRIWYQRIGSQFFATWTNYVTMILINKLKNLLIVVHKFLEKSAINLLVVCFMFWMVAVILLFGGC